MIRVRHSKSGRLLNYARFAFHFARAFPNFFGTEKKECPLCGNHGRFLAFGYPPRFDVICPRCGAFDRHRQVKLWIDANVERVKGRKIVHFAPEEYIAKALSAHAASYQGADLMPGKADICLNIEKIDLADSSVGMIVALMVLEHVDDHAALSEIFRVLEPGGMALFLVPVIEGWDTTLEEADLPTPIRNKHDRFRWFGQWDHARYYGRDVRDRIRAAGFTLEEYVAKEPEVRRYGLVRGETLFVATKP